MTLRWRQDVKGSGSRLCKVAGLSPSDVEVSCVCVCARARVRVREIERGEHMWTSGFVFCMYEEHKFVYVRIRGMYMCEYQGV